MQTKYFPKIVQFILIFSSSNHRDTVLLNALNLDLESINYILARFSIKTVSCKLKL